MKFIIIVGLLALVCPSQTLPVQQEDEKTPIPGPEHARAIDEDQISTTSTVSNEDMIDEGDNHEGEGEYTTIPPAPDSGLDVKNTTTPEPTTTTTGGNTSTTMSTSSTSTTSTTSTSPASTTSNSSSTSSTQTPVTSTSAPEPAPKSGGFHGWSFFGGMVLMVVVAAIGFVGFKYYKTRGGAGLGGNYNRF